jgi:hypothetical protein
VLVVDDRQRPAPAGEFAGDRGVCDHRAFLAGVETGPAVVQAPVGGLSAGPRRRTGGLLASPQIGSGPVPGSVMPGCFDKQSAGVTVAGLGDSALGTGGARRTLGGH